MYLRVLYPLERSGLFLTLTLCPEAVLTFSLYFGCIVTENPYSPSPLPQHLLIHPLAHEKLHSSSLHL